ncbi:methionine adenosyltransferase [Streptococcus mutans]|uniref:methionine adenosyltransferase n=1 Tax=Streptococcus mutans TaxID=1309 RepID=UPI0038BE03C4
MEVFVSNNHNKVGDDLDFEMVERKGVGHPDTISDAIAETASRKYSRYCVEKFGSPAHHWFDKVMLIGGEANTDFGCGDIEKPYTIIFAGKVSKYVGDFKIPLDEILYDSCNEVLSNVLTGLDIQKHLKIENKLVDYQGSGRSESRYRPSTVDRLPKLDNSDLVSNDTNLLTAFAPLSKLEEIVLETERFINGKDFKRRHPDTGWDVKIFGTREGGMFELLVNMPFLAKNIKNIDEYFKRKNEIYVEVNEFIEETFNIKIKLSMNATDRNGRAYLTALGSVADTGDVGVVGRGNRENGLITPMRPMSIEAPAGKNSVDHTGKLYGILANDIAKEIYSICMIPVEVYIYTSKESLLNNPDKILISLNSLKADEKLIKEIKKIVKSMVSKTGLISKKLIFEGITLW